MGLVVGNDIKTDRLVILDEAHRATGTYIIGKPGMGKTTLLASLILQCVLNDEGVCVLDPSGDLVTRVLQHIPSRRLCDVVLLDPCDYEWPFGLNPFDCDDIANPLLVTRIQSQFVDIFRKQWEQTSWGPRLEDLLRSIAITFIENPPYTMADISRLLTNASFRDKLIANVTNDEVRQFWEEDFRGLKGQALNQEIGSTMNKVRAFLTQPVVRNIVGQSRTTAKFRAFMDEKKIVLCPLPVGVLGNDATSLLGSLMVLEILNAAMSREEMRSRGLSFPQFSVFVDEYQRFATDAFATLLEEGRKYKVDVTTAHQNRSQLDDRNRSASLMSGVIVIFSVAGRDAEELAKELDDTPPLPEVRGREPILTPPRNAFDHLAKTGHSNPEVNALFKECWLDVLSDYLVPKAQSEEARKLGPIPDELLYASPVQWKEQNFRDFPYPEKYLWLTPKAAGLAVEDLNDYFASMMDGRTEPGSRSQADSIWHILMDLRAFYGFAPAERNSLSDESKKMLWYLLLATFDEINHPAHDASRMNAGRFFLDFQREREADWVRRATPTIIKIKEYPSHGKPVLRPAEEIASILNNVEEKRIRAFAPRAKWEAGQANRILRPLIVLGMLLAKDPILVNSGQWSPTVDRPRSHADVQAEIINQLVHKSNFEAKIKLQQAELDIVTPRWEPLAGSLEMALNGDRIRAAMRTSGYTRARHEVEAEIARRQKPPGDEGLTRIVAI